MAIRCLKQAALEQTDKLLLGSYHVKKNFYVDNLMCDSNSIQDLVITKGPVKNVLASGEFPLHKEWKRWCSEATEIGLESYK